MRRITWILWLSMLGFGFSQSEKPRPKFSDFPVQRIYEGKPAAPVLSKDQRIFRTVIREGARSKVEFAGHYTVPRHGCGTGCSCFYIADSINGKVYNGFCVADLPYSWLEQHGQQDLTRWEFHPNSRLLQINGCPGETNCGFYDYVFIESTGLKLIRQQLLPKEFQ